MGLGVRAGEAWGSWRWSWVAPGCPSLPILSPQVLALVQRKVLPTSEAVAPQSQELLRCLEEEARHLPHLPLGTLLRHSPEG